MKQPTDSKGRFARIYDPAVVWPDILNQICRGVSLGRAIETSGMSYDLAKRQLAADPVLRAEYDKAVQERGDYLAEEIVDLSDEMPPADLPKELVTAWVNRQRLRVDARKWTASRLRPRVWGERMEVSVSHTQISITQALKEAEARLIDADQYEDVLLAINGTTRSVKA